MPCEHQVDPGEPRLNLRHEVQGPLKVVQLVRREGLSAAFRQVAVGDAVPQKPVGTLVGGVTELRVAQVRASKRDDAERVLSVVILGEKQGTHAPLAGVAKIIVVARPTRHGLVVILWVVVRAIRARVAQEGCVAEKDADLVELGVRTGLHPAQVLPSARGCAEGSQNQDGAQSSSKDP
eukprot:CAMPEP_0170199498 /NCGR_PEP_ID=MMETSP0040_2-20121228/69373_1 /TAXON_ID=641309 /ORGANISM="Lotharella oceanica, Strain CCMP622" /LENGTH=178 /DNA_ID=CAMNT_0010449627 /DNA_START=889 /DNA_END=1421 /DNA_ORIENTATION=+